MKENAFDYYLVEASTFHGWETRVKAVHLLDAFNAYKDAIEANEEPVRLVGVNKAVLVGVTRKFHP